MTRIALLISDENFRLKPMQAGVAALARAGIETIRISSSGETEITRCFARLRDQKVSRVLVGGGDGTLNQAVRAMMKLERSQRLPVGIIPLGTANDFAKSAAFGEEGVRDALIHSAQANAYPVDIAWANGHPFVNVASGGCVSRNTTEASKGTKSLFGKFSYFLTGLAKITEIEEFELTFRAEGWEFQQSCLAFAVANSSSAGGGLQVGPEAKLDDGVLDLLIVPGQSLVQLAALTTELLKESPELEKHAVIYRQVKRLQVQAAAEIQVNLDGEPLKARTFSFHVEPRALEMIVSTNRLVHPDQSRQDVSRPVEPRLQTQSERRSGSSTRNAAP